MKNFIIRRLGQLLGTYFIFLSLLFVIFRLAPGDPTTMYALQGMSQEARQEMLERYGLNDPLHEQYINYIVDYLTLDLGHSYRLGQPVYDVVVIKFWNTIFLMGTAFALAYAFGVLFGAFLGWYRGTRQEQAGLVATLMARSSPEFWTAIVVMIVGAFWLNLFPAGGMRSPTANPQTFWARYLSVDFLRHLVLPVLAGAIYYMATPTLLMRNSMISVLDSDFVEIKKAEGIPEWIILYKHAARNSILPVTTVIAIVIGMSLGGSLLIERVFNWPGMGRAMITAVTNNDYPVAQALFFLMGSVVIFMNFVADIAYVYLDPRVQYE
jgi:peptide/nickel transport system permease protein